MLNKLIKTAFLAVVLLSVNQISLAAPSIHDFVMVVQTDNPGTSANNEFTIPTFTFGGVYNYNVDCDDDGNNEVIAATGNYTCVYPTIGSYTVRIINNLSGGNGFPRIYFQNTGDKSKVTKLLQWGTGKWTSMNGAFYGANKLVNATSDAPNLVAVSDMHSMFRLATSINVVGSNWDTTNVTTMRNMFLGATLATPDTSSWNTENVTDMVSMFFGATLANPDTSDWNTANVLNMSGMFQNATVADPDTSGWNTANVTNMHSMFRGATSANPDTSNWDISQVTVMNFMFFGVMLPTADYDAMLNGFNAQITQPVVFHGGNSKYCATAARANLISALGHGWSIADGGLDPSCSGMSTDDFVIEVTTDNSGTSANNEFTIPTVSGGYNYNVDCNNDGNDEATGVAGDYTCVYPIAGTYTIRIKDNTGTLDGFPLIYFNNQGDKSKIIDVIQWGTGKWKSMESSFYGANNMIVSATDIPNFSQLTSLRRMFNSATSANPDTSLWDTSSVTSMAFMFLNATSANPNTSNWNTANVITMTSMFLLATSANPNTSNWDTTNVINMVNMFAAATSANPDVSEWNTANVTNMRNMFAFTTLANPDTSEWNTVNVIDMENMFEGATSANPDTSSWNTENVMDMTQMFEGATSANPDTSNWNTANVTNMGGMFYNAISANPDTSSWDITNVLNMEEMFFGVTLPTIDYDAKLIGFNAQNLQSDVIFGGGNSKYCLLEAQVARASMVDNDNWTITDGEIDELDPSCIEEFIFKNSFENITVIPED